MSQLLNYKKIIFPSDHFNTFLASGDLCKQFGLRSGLTVGSGLDQNYLRLIVFLKEFFEKVIFEKLTSMQIVESFQFSNTRRLF